LSQGRESHAQIDFHGRIRVGIDFVGVRVISRIGTLTPALRPSTKTFREAGNGRVVMLAVV
jgi:hypothetical protein